MKSHAVHISQRDSRYRKPDFGFGGNEWQDALAHFPIRPPDPVAEFEKTSRIPLGWWQQAFANKPTKSETLGHPCGAHEMLMIVAYDITDEKRLRQVARHCEDFGVRVQYSMFECRLPGAEFESFWQDLKDLIDPKEDRIVAYRICAECAGDICTAGTMEVTSNEKVVAYVI